MVQLKLILLSLIVGFSIFGCSGSFQEEPVIESLLISEAAKGGIDLEEYIAPGIQFVENTSQGMTQEGFPYLKKSKTINIKWIIKTCDPNDPNTPSCAEVGSASNPDPGFYISRLYYSSDAGVNWVAISGASNLGGASDQMQSFSWSIPNDLNTESGDYKLKLITRNAAGQEFFALSSSFFIDNSAPVIKPETLKFNSSLDSPLVLKSPGINIEFEGEDNLTPIDAYCLKDSASEPTLSNSCWVKLSMIGLVESKQIQIKNIKKLLGWVGGSYSYYFWIKDKSGNVSRLTDEVGSSNIDYRVISYSPGRSVVFYKNLAGNADSYNENPKMNQTVINSSNNVVYFKWAYTLDPNTQLDDNPVKIEYSTDLVNFNILKNSDNSNMTDAQVNALVNQNCQTLSFSETNGHSSCLNWSVPSSLQGQTMYFRIHIKDSSGFIYSISTNPVNMSLQSGNNNLGMRVIAGLIDPLIGASALTSKFNIPQWAIGNAFAVHEDGRIFLYDSSYGILVINPTDGVSRVYVKLGTTSTDGIAADSDSMIQANETKASVQYVLKINIDYKGRLIILENNKIRQVTDEVDANGEKTGRRTLKTIVGCLQSSSSLCYFNQSLKSTAYNAKSPKQYWNNSWIYANEFTFPSPQNDINKLNRHFSVLPNGDIYFSINAEAGYISTTVPSSSNGYRGLDFRVYRPDANENLPGKIYSVPIGGSGVLGEPYKPISELYPSSVGGLSFNFNTGSPTVLNMVWSYCPPNTINQCEFYVSNHNPKTGNSMGTGVHYTHPITSMYNITMPKNGTGNAYLMKYITSRRGELYVMNSGQYGGYYTLAKLNVSTNKFEKILGTNYSGYCPDGTLANSCNTIIRDAWISQDNTIYFVDGFQIRMIGSDGRVVTLFGRRASDRSNVDAMITTLGSIEGVSKWTQSNTNTDRIMIKEPNLHMLREVTVQGQINKLSGNESTLFTNPWKSSVSKPGYFVSNVSLETAGFWHGSMSGRIPPLVVHPKSGEAITLASDNYYPVRMIRTDNESNADKGRWLRLLGGGSSTYRIGNFGSTSCDGRMNNQCYITYSNSHFAAMIPEKILDPDINGNPQTRPAFGVYLYSNWHPQGNWYQIFMKLINLDSGKVTPFAGNGDLTAYNATNMAFPDSYSPVAYASLNKIPHSSRATKFVYDENRDALIVGAYGTSIIGVIDFQKDSQGQILQAGNYYNLTKTPRNYSAFTHVSQNAQDVIYYCSTAGLLYRRVITSTSSSEVELPLPSQFKCVTTANGLDRSIDTDNNIIKLYIPLISNGQFSIGEYNVPLQL